VQSSSLTTTLEDCARRCVTHVEFTCAMFQFALETVKCTLFEYDVVSVVEIEKALSLHTASDDSRGIGCYLRRGIFDGY
jgi:hypothetical protein